MANATTKRVRVGDVCEIAHCISDFVSESVWLLNLDMVEQQTGRVIERIYVPVEEMGQSIVPFDSRCVLYSKLRPNLNKVVLPDSVGFATSEMLPLLPNDSLTTREYLAAFLRSDSFVRYATAKSFGAKMPRLGTKDLMAAQIPLPPLAEQKRIAEVLDKISAMKRNAEARVQKLDLLVKSRFAEMFGEGAFLTSRLADVAIVTGGLTKNARRKEFPLKYKYLRVANVFYNRLDLSDVQEIGVLESEVEKTLLKNDDLLFVEGNGSIEQIGRVALWNDAIRPCLHQNHIIKVRLSPCVIPTYALFYFMSSEGRRRICECAVSTTGLHTLSTGKVSSLPLPLPPLALQREFAAFVEKVEALKATAQRECEQVDLLYRAKLQEYFG